MPYQGIRNTEAKYVKGKDPVLVMLRGGSDVIEVDIKKWTKEEIFEYLRRVIR